MDRLGSGPDGNRATNNTFQQSYCTKHKLNANFIKQSLIPVDFYSHEIPGATLKRPEWNDGGLCPFHSDNNPGSFRVNLTTGAFKCFACGITGGDIIAFTAALHDPEFVEALAELADDWGQG